MKFGVFCSALLLSVVNYTDSKQVFAENGEALWLAIIDDDHVCKDVITNIKHLLHGHRRLLSNTNVGVLSDMDGGYDCFLQFSSPDKKVIEQIKKIEGVVSVEPDEEMTLFEFWGRDRADQDNLPLDNKKYNPSYNGEGQCLYIIDTGILPTHVDFTNRAELGADFINEADPNDMNGHGTHCASIAAGAIHGIAPMTSVIKGVKVLSGGGSGSSAGVIKGIQWAVNDANKMKKTCVLSLSLGGGKNTALDKAVMDAAKKHIVVVAAGNSNADACDGSPSGAGGGVITVGSTKNDDYRSSFSNFGKCVDIFAPGSDITAAYIGSNKQTKVLSGTSMATPHIAGLALQSLQKNNGDLKAAYNDLFATSNSGRIKDVGSGSPNLLGRIIDYTGPPTPPTLQPTMPPTKPDPTLCIKNKKTNTFDKCVDFQPSQFGTFPWKESPMEAVVVKPAKNADSLMCKPSKDDFTGKFVLVKRGSCLFMDKIKNCEKQGALGVFIYNNNAGAIFPPAYYGDETTSIPSCMISKTDGIKAMSSGDDIHWGVLFDDGGGGNNDGGDKPVPTKIPTTMPTKSPTTKPTPFRCDVIEDPVKCRKNKKCRWDGYVCYIKVRYQKK